MAHSTSLTPPKKMTKEDDASNFVKLIEDFYESFFLATGNAVLTLADAQEKFPESYTSWRDFAQDPTALQELIDELDTEKQALFLRLLLKATSFARNFNRLFDLTVAEKKKFAEDLKTFAGEMKKVGEKK